MDSTNNYQSKARTEGVAAKALALSPDPRAHLLRHPPREHRAALELALALALLLLGRHEHRRA